MGTKVDRNLIDKYKLNGVVKRLNEMNRYNEHLITEAPGDPNEDPNQNPVDDQMQGGMPGDNIGAGGPMGGNQAQGGMNGGNPMDDALTPDGMNGGDMNGGNPMGDAQAQGTIPDDDVDQNEPGMPDMDAEDKPDDESDDDDVSDETDTSEPEEDDEVIDVDDLTISQEETERELGTVNKNMKTLLKVVKQCIQSISDNDKKLEDLMAEYERRNPTADEKVNVRRAHSGPFSDTPDDFWGSRGEKIHDENMIDPRHDTEYVITFDDANDFSEKDVADSLSKFPSKLEDFLKF